MKTLITTAFTALLLASNAQAVTEFKCAGDDVLDRGVRVNLNRSESGTLRANLIFGTTVSGTMFNVTEVSPGIFEGAIKGKPQFAIRLAVSSKPAENKYIRGAAAELEVIYPNQTVPTGISHLKTSAQQNFACGKQVRGYNN